MQLPIQLQRSTVISFGVHLGSVSASAPSPAKPLVIPFPRVLRNRKLGCLVGQTNACSVVFRGKQHVREFEIRPRSSSSSVEATGDSQRVKTYGLVNIVYIFID